jgi:PDZ domain-containing protein
MTVAYFTEHEPEYRRRFAGGWVGWGLIAAIVIGASVVSFVPSGHVIEWPGPVHDTLGTLELEGDSVSVVDIPSQQTYPTTGSLTMLTVSTLGDREQPASWLQVFEAWLDPSQEFIPVDEAFPQGQTTEQSAEENAALMRDSQQDAVAAALNAAGYEFSTFLTIADVDAEGPSADLLLPGDVITAINREPAEDVDILRALIGENGTELPATVTVTRAGAPVDVLVTPVLSEGDDPQPILGISPATSYDFPFEVNIQLGDIGGPSAGQILALAVIDKLTPGSLNGGLAVAGTGTITPEGEIGPIGGITQKLYGAQRAGAHIFLAPASNCDDIADGTVPQGLDIYAVSTLADSIYVLNTLAAGAGTSLLPRCPRD